MSEREAIAALAGVVARRMWEPITAERFGDEAEDGCAWVVWHYWSPARAQGCAMLAGCGVGLLGVHDELWLREPDDLDRAAETVLARPLDNVPLLSDAIHVALSLAEQVWTERRGGDRSLDASIRGQGAEDDLRMRREREEMADAEIARLRASEDRLIERTWAAQRRWDEVGYGAGVEPARDGGGMSCASPDDRVPADLDIVLRGLGLRDDAGWTAASETQLWRQALRGADMRFVDDPRFNAALDRCLDVVPEVLHVRWKARATHWTSARSRHRGFIVRWVRGDLSSIWRLEGWVERAEWRRAVGSVDDAVIAAAASIVMERLSRRLAA